MSYIKKKFQKIKIKSNFKNLKYTKQTSTNITNNKPNIYTNFTNKKQKNIYNTFKKTQQKSNNTTNYHQTPKQTLNLKITQSPTNLFSH